MGQTLAPGREFNSDLGEELPRSNEEEMLDVPICFRGWAFSSSIQQSWSRNKVNGRFNPRLDVGREV